MIFIEVDMSNIEHLLSSIPIHKSIEPQYYDAVYKFFKSLETDGLSLEENLFYLKKLCIPEYIHTFQIPWEDDQQVLHVQTGYRVQHNRALGLYKGGLRFHKTVNLDIIKALAFEQTFKNALTGFSMGGAKGGSDFDPKGKSKSEIRRFSMAFMEKLAPFIGENKDIPAGDLGVDSYVLGIMNATYQHLYQGNYYPLTGKPVPLQGSRIRTEATGFGLIYFVEAALLSVYQKTLKGLRVLISGSGNVGIHAAMKAHALGAIVVGISDSTSYLYDPNGLDIDAVIQHKHKESKPLNTFKNQKIVFTDGLFWHHKADIALPSAKENDILLEDISYLHKEGVLMVAEGANLAVDIKAISYMEKHHIMYGPGKAANAGGVIVSALEIEQNKTFTQWPSEVVDQKLKHIMETLFLRIYEASNHKKEHFMTGANRLAFEKILEAMILRGLY